MTRRKPDEEVEAWRRTCIATWRIGTNDPPSGVPGYSDAFESWLDPAHTAVLEIDMHRGHVGEDDRLTLAVPRAKERVPAHNRFQAECRSVGIPIIHVQHWQRHGGSTISTTASTTGWRIGECSTTSTSTTTR